MRIFWWQDGIHIGPDSKEEHDMLAKVWRVLERLKFEFPDRSTRASDDIGVSTSGKSDDN